MVDGGRRMYGCMDGWMDGCWKLGLLLLLLGSPYRYRLQGPGFTAGRQWMQILLEDPLGPWATTDFDSTQSNDDGGDDDDDNDDDNNNNNKICVM